MPQTVRTRPRIACEIAADRVVAARAHEGAMLMDVHSTRRLSDGTVVPGLAPGNVLHKEELRLAVSDVLATVGGRTRDLMVIIPDAAVRVMLLDFESLPEDPAEAAGIVRFRLRKSLPFDIDQAALSYQAHRGEENIRVVAAVAPRAVIQEYESVFVDLGYSPGVVLPSMLATLGVVSGERPTMVVKIDRGTITVAIVDGDELRLFRTLENPGGARVNGAQVASEIFPSVVFFEDTFGEHIEGILVSGASASEIAPALQEQSNARVQDLPLARYVTGDLSPDVPGWSLAGVAGALLG
jgi:type IV pilus assembly protein PilM